MVSATNAHRRAGALIVSTILSLSFCCAVHAHATEHVLYAFRGGNDGIDPAAGLLLRNDGIFYGTTAGGGGGNCRNSVGCGTIFSLTPEGAETVLYAFQGSSDGAVPDGNLIRDNGGNLYGTTETGGDSNCGTGCGTVFRLAQGGSETILYAFQGGSDGWGPRGNLILDTNGNLYGATVVGGNYNGSDCTGEGCGAVFELKSDGTKETLYAFQGGTDGALPLGGVIADKLGNLYGTTSEGGTNCDGEGIGCGTVFKIAGDGTETILHSFQGGSDGRSSWAGLISDSAGGLYGTTISGGSAGCGGQGCGTVFKITADGTESVLYSFQGGIDGNTPEAGLVMDKAGNLYGTTFAGGSTHCHRAGCGAVFKLAPDGTETILYAFTRAHGQNPAAALLLKNGRLYGTATAGGAKNDGVVFSVRK